MTGKNYSLQELNEFYAKRHEQRGGIFGSMPYANYGYWIREGMTIDEACNALTDLIASELDVNDSDKILECGCGYGASTIYIATHYNPEQIVGIDITDIRIQLGAQLIKEKNLDRKISIRFGDATHLDFEPESFTKVMAIECAFHFNTRKDFFNEAFRVLKPGGVLAMADIVPSSDINLNDYTLEQIRDFLSAEVKRYSDDNIYDLNVYESHLKNAGFSPVKIYSIKDKVILQFADHLESVQLEPPDLNERKNEYAKCFRNKLMVGGDYIVVRAQKPMPS